MSWPAPRPAASSTRREALGVAVLDEAGLLALLATGGRERARAAERLARRARAPPPTCRPPRRARPLLAVDAARRSVGSIEPRIGERARRPRGCRSPPATTASAGASPRRPTRRSRRSPPGCTTQGLERAAGATSGCGRRRGRQRARGVERAVVRVLGITTRAVHLVGFAPDGRVWVQQRAFDKATDPGLLGHADGRPGQRRRVGRGDARARDAGRSRTRRSPTLLDLRRGDRITVRRPVAKGYVIEHIEVFEATVLPRLVPTQPGRRGRALRVPAIAACSSASLRARSRSKRR